MTAFKKRVVVKLGGSLLSQPSLSERLNKWLETKSASDQLIFIVGGGPTVEGLRHINHANLIQEEISHWTAIKLMDANALILKSWFPEWATVDEFRGLLNGSGSRIIFQVETFLNQNEPNLPGDHLPIGWQTTSDAIAARLAECLQAKLILLKSVAVKAPYDWELMAKEGFVDPVLASRASHLDIKIETLPIID